MVSHRVVFAPEAEAQIVSLYRYIRQEASADIAERFTASIIAHCEGLATFPHRGTPRDDIRPGMRTISFRRRVVIAYTVDGDRVSILGMYYGGQDFAAGWADEDQPEPR
jgi:toxin ParE1/3/4